MANDSKKSEVNVADVEAVAELEDLLIKLSGALQKEDLGKRVAAHFYVGDYYRNFRRELILLQGTMAGWLASQGR